MKKKHYSEKEIKEIKLKIQKGDCLTSDELNYLWEIYTNGI